jgi:hypothetical protein
MSSVESSLAARLTGRRARSHSLVRFGENDNEYTLLSIYISFVNAARTYPSFFGQTPWSVMAKVSWWSRVAQPECFKVTVN